MMATGSSEDIPFPIQCRYGLNPGSKMKPIQSCLCRGAGIAAILLLSVGMYLLFIRPWHLQWGATDEEAARYMPGDDLVLSPTFNSTRGITIESTPSEIWPWLVQMGYGRAGFYGYDLIENLGSKRGLTSAESIIPELQQLKVGDDMPISVVAVYKINKMEPNRFLVWSDDKGGAFTWGLYPLDEGHTRLILRFRFRHHWYDWIFTEWADPVAVRKILLGVKDRAEGRVETLASQNLEIMVWGMVALELMTAVILSFRLSHWWRGWLLTFAAAASLIFTLYFPQFHATGIFLVAVLLAGLLWSMLTAQFVDIKADNVVFPVSTTRNQIY